MLEVRTCNRCGTTARQVPIGVLVSEPQGWTNLTISGLPVTNMRLCPPCTRDVRMLVSVSPANLERARDADLQAAFTRGYDDGQADWPSVQLDRAGPVLGVRADGGTRVSAIVVGVDPGETTGIAALSYAQHSGVTALAGRFAVQVNGHVLVVPIVQAIIDHWSLSRPMLAIEQFVVSTRAARSGSAFAGRITRELVAALQALAVDHAAGTALDVVTRPAALVKPWATDQRLEAAGLLDSTKGMGHARDAARHALYAAVHDGIARDPLSGKAVG
jgi:hypothetical protein